MGTSKEKRPVTHSSPLARIYILVGFICIAAALIILGLTFYPILREEFLYRIRQTRPIPSQQEPFEVTPIDTEFGIVIPKLGANARVIANVDPYDESAYQKALARGVAHARGTVYPGQNGNMFVFSHSSVDFYRATQFNSVFYLLSKLEPGDQIEMYYQNVKYIYQVTEKKIVEAGDTSYLSPKATGKVLTLMTCWPPGTSLKRLIVKADILEQ
jgi:LPXTG-site transpeptidase (sortase) family protein